MAKYKGREVTQAAVSKWAESADAPEAPTIEHMAERLGLKLAAESSEYGRRIALYLNEKRADLGWDVATVAAKSGLAYMTVKNVLLGKSASQCRHRTFVLLCLALGVLPAAVWEEVLTTDSK